MRDRGLDRHRHAVAGLGRLAIEREQMRAEQPGAGVLVRYPQRLERQDQRVDRKLRQQQEADALGPPLSLRLADCLVARHERDAPLRQLHRS